MSTEGIQVAGCPMVPEDNPTIPCNFPNGHSGTHSWEREGNPGMNDVEPQSIGLERRVREDTPPNEPRTDLNDNERRETKPKDDQENWADEEKPEGKERK